MVSDLGIKVQQLNKLSLFYIPFVSFTIPIALSIRHYNSANTIPVLMFTFDANTLFGGYSVHFWYFYGRSWFWGMCESAFFPGIVYYLLTFYRRQESACNLSVFHAAVDIVNALSGLLSFEVF